MTKTELINDISANTSVSKKDVRNMLTELEFVTKMGLRKEGEFTIPGLVKLRVVTKPATKARMGRNPATGEEMEIAAKPRRKVIKARILKTLKMEVLTS